MDEFTKGFLQAGLVTNHGDKFSLDDIGEETVAWATKECKIFRKNNSQLLEGLDLDQSGFSFWLARNYYAVCYWDWGLSSMGEELIDAAQSRSQCCLIYESGSKISHLEF